MTEGDDMREYLKKAMRRLPLLAATLSASALIVAMPSVSAAGVKKGLIICASSAVPSLYPFCVLSAFFVRSGLCGYLGKFLEKPVRILFALPGSAGAAACISFVAGYPVGAGMTAALLSDGSISRSNAQRMTLFCVNAGPAFVIGGVGAGMLGSVRAGVLIFASLTLASLTLGILTRFVPHGDTGEYAAPTVSGSPLSRALTEAVADGTKNIISICAWIVMFACAAQYIPLLRLPDWAGLLLSCTLEVTGGCASAVGVFNIPAIAAVLGWGGVSVHCQIMRHIKTCGTPLPYFFCARLVCAALAALFCEGLLRLFPCPVSTVSLGSVGTVQMFSFSAPAAFAMLLSGAMLILELDTSEKKC